MNISRALSIEGWMSESELLWLAEQASHAKTIVEIGSWLGRSTVGMADNTSGTIYAVDTWKGSKEQVHYDILSAHPEDWLYFQFVENTSANPNIYPMKRTSLHAAQTFLKHNIKFDLIFIDASHDYENVRADILAWKPLLAENGIIAGHDINWSGVRQAVTELTLFETVPNTCIWKAV